MSHVTRHTEHRSLSIEIDRDFLRSLGRPAPLRLLLQVALEWTSIAMLVWLGVHAKSMILDALVIPLIATRQHALLALMHEFSHYQFSRARKTLNDFIGNMFTALPFFVTVQGFRRNHLPHHQHVATDSDPNWVASLKKERYRFPKTRRQVYWEICKHCAGWYTIDELKRYTVDAGMSCRLPRTVQTLQAGFYLLASIIVVRSGLWIEVLIYWLLPLSTFLMAILYVRDIGEHFGMRSPGVAGSRTVLASLPERLFISQNQVNFHAEHHLFPSVPFFRLPQLHARLRRDPAFRRHAVVTHGYFPGLVEEVSTDTAARPEDISCRFD